MTHQVEGLVKLNISGQPLKILSFDWVLDKKVTCLVTKETKISSHRVPGEQKLHSTRVQARRLLVLTCIRPGFCKQHWQKFAVLNRSCVTSETRTSQSHESTAGVCTLSWLNKRNIFCHQGKLACNTKPEKVAITGMSIKLPNKFKYRSLAVSC